MKTELETVDKYAWWASLNHGGLLISPSRLSEFFTEEIKPLNRFYEDQLRRDVALVRSGETGDISSLLDTVLESVLGLYRDFWQKASQVDSSWSIRSMTGDIIKPRRLWQEPNGGTLPVFTDVTVKRLGIGKGRRSVSRVIEWLRKSGQKLALLTNGRQWRLIHAGSDYSAWCEWDIELWFEEGKPSLQVTALRSLLSRYGLSYGDNKSLSPLLGAITASRQGQAELSDNLGERVRQAVELLIRETITDPPKSPLEKGTLIDSPKSPLKEGTSSDILAKSLEKEASQEFSPLNQRSFGESTPSNREIYIAATRMIMRCVVILFAEARDLLPRNNPIYNQAYGLQGLREQLDKRAGGRAKERLRHSYSAYPRLLGLFRLIFLGSHHEALLIPRYGGGLFAIGDANSDDPILRALYLLENPQNTPSDAVVYRILELLTRSKIKVRQGRKSIYVDAPIDFSDLSSEYIGILYEGLLDFELRRSGEDDPIIFLNLGDQPALPLQRLENMDDKALEGLMEKLKKASNPTTEDDSVGVDGINPDDEDDTVDGINPEDEEDSVGVDGINPEIEEIEADIVGTDGISPEYDDNLDLVAQYRERAYQWAIRAVKAGKLVAKPKSKKPEKLADYENQVSKMAKQLISRLILPNEWFLVRWGGTRKGSGTFYTRPQLAVPTVRRTLEPLVYSPHPLTPSPTEGRIPSPPSPLSQTGRRGINDVPSSSNSLSQQGRGGTDRWEISAELKQKMTEIARKFRKESTNSEAILWQALRNRQLEGYKFRRQQPIGAFIVDFFCASERLIVEVDGKIHDSQRESDRQRQELLESLGLRFVRVSAEDVENNLETVLNTISNALKSNQTPLYPLGRGAGGEGNTPPLPTWERGLGGEGNTPPLPTWERGLGGEGQIPQLPEIILNLKICDPAMGSGSFLVAALRYLTDALYESLHYHQRIAKHGDRTLCRLAEGEDTNSLLVETLPILPDSEQFEERLKGRLKRYIVERCIYGVDIDPLAVELGRLALWVETMDKTLPFSFVDHKLKCGNALVGCWFDRFQDYPAMAWERKGGDESHSKFVHHFREVVTKSGQIQQKGDKWSQAIKEIKSNIVKEELKNLLKSLDPNESFLDYPDFNLPKVPEAIHDEALEIFERLHNLPVYDTESREKIYREEIKRSEAIKKLKFAFDTWCAVWFWNGDLLEFAPTPNKFFNPPEETREIIEQLAQEYQFFHWELEFPDVFNNVFPHPLTPSPNEERRGINVKNSPLEKETEDKKNTPPLPTWERGLGGEGNSGFSAIIGNPPWEIQKPNSMEFFSNIDPLYRTYGKQDALQKQVDYFTDDPNIEKAWLSYCDRLKALSNWTKNVGYPWGDSPLYHVERGDRGEGNKYKFSLSRSAKETEFLHELWRNRRSQEKGYADPRHPFILQGSADINTYKMFLELSLSLLGNQGRMGLIVPSGVYTDKGSTNLRTEFLEFNQWEWLFGFENRDKIFDIHRSFKFCPIIVVKGGQTSAIKATFMQHSLSSWENAEDYILDYPRQRVEQFSPNSKAILEIRNQRDLQVLEKMYENSILLGDNSPQGWGIQYATEFHMTNDSKLFPPRPQWEKKGYIADEYGHWLKGKWQDLPSPPSPLSQEGRRENESILNRPAGVILSADKTQFILIDDVEDVALPLYQGVMIWQFDPATSDYLRGSSKSTKWIKRENHILLLPNSQYLAKLKDVKNAVETSVTFRLGFRSVQNASNQRTMIATLIPACPCGNSVATIDTGSLEKNLLLLAFLCSFPLDWVLRPKMSQGNVNWFYVEELSTSQIKSLTTDLKSKIVLICASLTATVTSFIPFWMSISSKYPQIKSKSFYRHLAITPYERLRLRCILDAVIAELYGLEIEDFEWILRDCDYPTKAMKDKQFYRTLDPKGFWRVDKEKDPELRHTVLSLVAFHELKSMGLEAFLNLNQGEGWIIPHTLTLADYGLGHDERAKHPQPVAERFLPSQTSNKDSLTSNKDLLMSNKDSLTSNKDSLTSNKDLLMSNKDSLMSNKDSLMSNKDSLMSNKDSLTSNKDSLTSNKDSQTSDKDSQTSDKDSSMKNIETIDEYQHLRYYPWQLEANIEESWLECERHAENLKKLLGENPQSSLEKGEKTKENQLEKLEDQILPSDPNFKPPTDLFGNPLQVDLFGNIVDDKPKKRKK